MNKHRRCNNCNKEATIPVTSQAGIFCSGECEEETTKKYYDKYCEDLDNQVANGELSIEEMSYFKRTATGGYTDEEVEKRAKSFLNGIVKGNKDKVMEIKSGWMINGKNDTYFMTTSGCAYIFMGNATLEGVCIESRSRHASKNIHPYDIIASKILALINDDKWSRDD